MKQAMFRYVGLLLACGSLVLLSTVALIAMSDHWQAVPLINILGLAGSALLTKAFLDIWAEMREIAQSEVVRRNRWLFYVSVVSLVGGILLIAIRITIKGFP
jgi:hypothetical protein